MSQNGGVSTKPKGQKPPTGPGKKTNPTLKLSRTSNISTIRKSSKPAMSSATKLSSKNSGYKTGENAGSSVSKSILTKTTKKNAAKHYEPIRLPEDILTIQAHSVSTPVTELPYLLIAAHIGSLPTAKQFYPPTSATQTPLTVFRDMFVMTIDVRGFKPSSIRLSTEGQLIIIEGLQSEAPQVVFTQTGTIDVSDKYVIDPTPTLSSMPVHTTFNYVQHRVKLPDEFSDDGLRVGLDDVSGHVVITGRLVHDQKSAFPESWNKPKSASKRGKKPLINPGNLTREDVRKLAAFQAVQGSDDENSQEIPNSTLLAFGKRHWLEREGAKLRAVQHRGLKENIRRLTEMKKSMSTKSSRTAVALSKLKIPTEVQSPSNSAAPNTQLRISTHGLEQGKVLRKSIQERIPLDPSKHQNDTLVEVSSINPVKPKVKQGNPAVLNKLAKVKLSRILNGPEQPKIVKKSTLRNGVNPSKFFPKKETLPRAETVKKLTKMSVHEISRKSKVMIATPQVNMQDYGSTEAPETAEAVDSRIVKPELNFSPREEGRGVDNTEADAEENIKERILVLPKRSKSKKICVEKQSRDEPSALDYSSADDFSPTLVKMKSHGTLRVIKRKSKSKETSRSHSITEQSASSASTMEKKSGVDSMDEDPIGRQDKAMWEKLLNYAGVSRRPRLGM